MSYLPDIYQHFERAFPNVHAAHQELAKACYQGGPLQTEAPRPGTRSATCSGSSQPCRCSSRSRAAGARSGRSLFAAEVASPELGGLSLARRLPRSASSGHERTSSAGAQPQRRLSVNIRPMLGEPRSSPFSSMPSTPTPTRSRSATSG
jgi:hypothetical protein